MEIFELSKDFPAEEKYSLTSQIRKASRSVPANITEAYRKRRYVKSFVAKLSDAETESAETQTWLNFAGDCGYIPLKECTRLNEEYDKVLGMLVNMIHNPESWTL